LTRQWETAVRHGDIAVLETLWSHQGNIDARNRHNHTALMIAAQEGHGLVVTWLIERGAALNNTAKYGLSALMLAVVRGHADVVRRLVTAGADSRIRGTGAPGFAGKTALDLAMESGDVQMIEALQGADAQPPTASHRYFASATSWAEARAMLTFQPIHPEYTAGFPLKELRIHVRDHKQREVLPGDRTLEAYYGGFTFSQSRKRGDEARRLALTVSYGREPREARISGHPARLYDLGPEPEPDDIDGRSPAVVAWHEGEMFYLIASGEMASEVLVAIANSIYA
jgi:hypothetical protein